MLFMVIESFRDNDMLPVYQRVRDAGRMLPEGLTYVDSWVQADFARCFQLMACDNLAWLGCPEGKSGCEAAIRHVQEDRLNDMKPHCLASAKTSAEARRCGTVNCEVK